MVEDFPDFPDTMTDLEVHELELKLLDKAMQENVTERHPLEGLNASTAPHGEILPLDALPLATRPHGPETAEMRSLVGPHVATVAEGEPGQVDFLYNFGAAAPASPGLQNQRGEDRCFPGLRIYHTETGRWWGSYADAAAMAGNLAFYWHAWMPTMLLDANAASTVYRNCSGGETFQPIDRTMSVTLHAQEKYIANIRTVLDDPYMTNVSIFAARTSYMHDSEYVFESMQHYGWGLVGSAYHPGGTVYGGAQISHLIQWPETEECVLTFQGSNSIQGWIANFDFPPAHFCGFTDPDETCNDWSTCRVRHERGSFVHAGFKGRITAIVRTEAFQTQIRPNLGKCSRLTAVGHSLGGAVGELFAACAAKAPGPTEYGYEDYQHISWTKEAPARLTYIGAGGKKW